MTYTEKILELLEQSVKEVTNYGFNDEYGYYNDWANGVRPILEKAIAQALALAEERERVKEEIEKYSSMEEVVVNEQRFLRDKNENEIKIRLGTGKTLIIHDVDLEADGQAWYEEV